MVIVGITTTPSCTGPAWAIARPAPLPVGRLAPHAGTNQLSCGGPARDESCGLSLRRRDDLATRALFHLDGPRVRRSGGDRAAERADSFARAVPVIHLRS